jgi:hypothetical protein
VQLPRALAEDRAERAAADHPLGGGEEHGAGVDQDVGAVVDRLVDDRIGQRLLDLRVLEALGGVVGERVRLENLLPEVERHSTDHREHAADDREHDRDDPPRPCAHLSSSSSSSTPRFNQRAR